VEHEFEFKGGNLALDFVGTVAERGTTDLDQLTTEADLARWFHEAGVVDSVGRIGPGEFARAKELRETLYRITRALTSLDPLRAGDLRHVNAVAAGAPPIPHVDRAELIRRRGDVDAAMTAVARAGLDLFDEGVRPLVQWCGGHNCTRAFIDHSRGTRRRWCDMAGCGDRAKAAAYRARRRPA
jgi:predicted RNA-binding Zn ribbon-like protein